MHLGSFRAAMALALGPPLLLTATAAWPIGDFGPETCMEGYVWREACGLADKVCVRPQVREQARADNREARARVSAADRRFGPDTCNPGFVWREACGPGDHVCVTPQVRGQARADNDERGNRLKYPYCQGYARDAANAQRVNELYRCGYSGNRWQTSEANHFGWCLGAPDRDTGGERAARYKQLDSCNSRAGQLARAGKSFPDSPGPTPGPGGGTPTPPPTNKCCWMGSAQGAYHTCGPQCP